MRGFKNTKYSSNKFKGKETFEDSYYGIDPEFESKAGKPEDTRTEDFKIRFDRQFMKDLPKAEQSINVKADPYDEASSEAGPYNVFAKNNIIENPRYKGEPNVDGANAQETYNLEMSSFLSYFDMARLRLPLNYRMICMKKRTNASGDVTNYRLIAQMYSSFLDALANVDASTYTNLAAFNYVVQTDIPLIGGDTALAHIWDGNHYVVDGKDYYTGSAAVFLCMIMYQNIIQNVGVVFAAHNQERLFRRHRKVMGFEREAATLQRLWGRYDSKSYIANWQSLSTDLEGEYFDREWLKMVNMFGALVSRKSNAIMDPLIMLSVYLTMPNSFQIFDQADWDGKSAPSASALLFSLANFKTSVSYFPIHDVTGASIELKTEVLSFQDVVKKIIDYVSPYNEQMWARQQIDASKFTDFTWCTQQNLSTSLTNLVTALGSLLAYFKSKMSQIRKVLEIGKRVGMCNWERGCDLGLIRDTGGKVVYNTTLTDLMTGYFCGSEHLVVDEKTSRWTGHTLVNKYYGIPAFDYWSGGAFIQTSLKQVQASSIVSTDYMPYLFDYPVIETGAGHNNYDIDTVFNAGNRYGEQVEVTYAVIEMDTNSVLQRLIPISQMDDLSVRVPTNVRDFAISSSTPQRGVGSLSTISCFYHFLENLFHIGLVQIQKDGVDVSDVVLSSDIVMFTDTELYNIQNTMISYGKYSGPFSMYKGKAEMGFQGVDNPK